MVRATPQSMLASGFVAMCADETLGDMVRGYTPNTHVACLCGLWPDNPYRNGNNQTGPVKDRRHGSVTHAAEIV